jgi:hypothetical protein
MVTDDEARADAREAVAIVRRTGLTPEGFAGAARFSIATAKRILAGEAPSYARTRESLRGFVQRNRRAKKCSEIALAGGGS